MDTGEVLSVVAALDGAGVTWCCDGGWGIDALVGKQTRAHDDLDLVVPLDSMSSCATALAVLGYRCTLDESPTRAVLSATDGRRVDLHLVSMDEHGGVQALPGGGSFRYPTAGLAGAGRIGGRTVSCLTPAAQVLVHAGYEPDRDDVHDLRLLGERTGVSVPPPYAHEAGGAAVAARDATTADAAAIAVVRQRSWRAAYRGHMPDDILDNMDLEQSWRFWDGLATALPARHGVRVIGSPGEVIGFATLNPARDEELDGQSVGEIAAIYLDPTAWGLGAGRPLLADAEDWLREAGFGRAVLWVLKGNARARRFYEREGWTVDGSERHGGPGGDAWTEVRYGRVLLT